MSTLAEQGVRPRLLRRLSARAWAWLLAIWGAVTGVAPHVLHHVGPLAGAALLAGTGGRLLFAALALVVSIPFLLRIHYRFRSWLAPAIALAAMAGTFALSSLLIAPLITGSDSGPGKPGIEQPGGHMGHHPSGGS
jgi:hypothetical protein